MSRVRLLASLIDQTLLRPVPDAEAAGAYRRAARAGCAAFVTHARYLPELASLRGEGTTRLAAVVDFPFGLAPTAEKLRQAAAAASAGAEELDMVLNLADALSGRWSDVERELAELERGTRGLVRKVIVETALHGRESIATLGRLVAGAGFEFVKTSTGYARRGATAADVRLLAAAAGPRCAVKASGGIAGLARCLSMVAAGAARIGTSRGLEILEEARRTQGDSPLGRRLRRLVEEGRG